MISTDRAMLGESVSTGDAINRHRQYGTHVEKLDIIIFSSTGYQTKKLADNVFCYPTNSPSKLLFTSYAKKIARNLYNQGGYDLIVCQDPFLTGLVGKYLANKFNSKLLIHFHGDFWDNSYWLKDNFLNYHLLLISKFTVPSADAIRVVSSGIAKKLISSGIDKKKIKVIPTPVDLQRFEAPNNQTVDSIKSEFKGKKIIFWVGRMNREKNIPWFLSILPDLIKKYPNFIFLLAGKGERFDLVQRKVVKLNLSDHVKLLGHVAYNNLPNYYHASDIFVLPSLHESLGKVLLEAAATAKPAVASKTTGATEIIRDKESGFLVPINDKKKFISSLEKLLSDQKLAAKLGSNAYDNVLKDFNYKGGINTIINYWEEVSIGFDTKSSKI